MDTKLTSNTLDFRIANPMCAFCKHSYTKFFQTWCEITGDFKKRCAKTCPDYAATVEKIERRSC